MYTWVLVPDDQQAACAWLAAVWPGGVQLSAPAVQGRRRCMRSQHKLRKMLYIVQLTWHRAMWATHVFRVAGGGLLFVMPAARGGTKEIPGHHHKKPKRGPPPALTSKTCACRPLTY